MNNKRFILEKAATLLVGLMALLQGFYAVFSYIDPSSFAVVRGTELISLADSDWVKIYASRTLFIALIIGYLLYKKEYRCLMWASLFGSIMPIIDGLLAFEASAPTSVVVKHIVTLVYLIVTALVLKYVVAKSDYK
jgi:hypothetical protein